MAAQADSALPTESADLAAWWRITLVVGLTVAVVSVWALHDPQPAPAIEPAPPAAAPHSSPAPAAAPVPPLNSASAAPQLPEVMDSPIAAPAEPKPWSAQSGIIPGRPDPPAPPRPAAFERYVVQRGETLVLIAALRGVALADLLIFNPDLGDGSSVTAGASIWIPIWEAEDDD